MLRTLALHKTRTQVYCNPGQMGHGSLHRHSMVRAPLWLVRSFQKARSERAACPCPSLRKESRVHLASEEFMELWACWVRVQDKGLRVQGLRFGVDLAG